MSKRSSPPLPAHLPPKSCKAWGIRSIPHPASRIPPAVPGGWRAAPRLDDNMPYWTTLSHRLIQNVGSPPLPSAEKKREKEKGVSRVVQEHGAVG